MNTLQSIRGQTCERVASTACPCCKKPLYVSLTGISSELNPVAVFCLGEDCRSLATSEGATGRDLEDATRRLELLFRIERINEINQLKEEYDFEIEPETVQTMGDRQWRVLTATHRL